MAVLIGGQEEPSPWLTGWSQLLAEDGRCCLTCVRGVLHCCPKSIFAVTPAT